MPRCQSLYKKPLYNAAIDFTPVALIAEVPIVLITRKDLPVNNLQGFVAYAKANQAKMQYGSAGAGSATHLGCVLLNYLIGVEFTHVPYRGTSPAMQDLQGGRIDYLCEIVSTAKPQIEGGTVKGIAMMTKERYCSHCQINSAAIWRLPAELGFVRSTGGVAARRLPTRSDRSCTQRREQAALNAIWKAKPKGTTVSRLIRARAARLCQLRSTFRTDNRSDVPVCPQNQKIWKVR
jgi:Tripartite tricarboxylate transporter family receptor